MTVQDIRDVEFGVELPAFNPDTSLAVVSQFARAVGWGGARFEDHEGARKQGLPGALVPGIMGMGFLTTMIHQWCPQAKVEHIDTVFRAPMIADEPCIIGGVVTDIDEEEGVVELDMTIKNTADETRVFGTAKVRLPVATD
jgi:acyl dehydratase